MRKIPIWYRKWSNMIRRCHSPATHNYKWYGGRGIKVCPRWRQWKYGAQNFLADMGEPPHGMTLGRINNDGDYEPGNCQWETMAEQGKNRRPRCQTEKDLQSLKHRCRLAGMPYMLVYGRIRAGWTEELAITTPKGRQGRTKGFKKELFGKPGSVAKIISPPEKAASPLI